MPAGLLERQDHLDELLGMSAAAAAGRGGIAVISGEPGIGKTSLVRAFLDRLDPQVRVLTGHCDDLLAPRALGPLRDAAGGTGGPLDRALDGPPDAVYGAVVEELSRRRPTVLAVEDVHWADDATLDVLRYLAPRMADLPAVLVISVRDDAVLTGHPVQRLLGALAAGPPTRWLRLAPLSGAAVAELARPADRDGPSLFAATGGNPFFVTEALAVPTGVIPDSVADAVLARLRRLTPGCVAALEQLSVVPNAVDFPLAEALLRDRLAQLAEAEERGIVEVRGAVLGFRHELARRAVEGALPRLRRRALHQEVVRALRAGAAGGAGPDLERLVHHAVQADDGDTVAEFAPRAGRAAATAGSHRQALALLAAALPYGDRLPPGEHARLVADHSWELYLAHRFAEAVAAGRDAVRRYARLDDPVATGEAMVRLSRHIFMTGDSDEAERVITEAVELLSGTASAPALAAASTYQAALLTLTGRSAAAIPALARARTLAAAADRPELESLCLNYLGLSRADLGDRAGGEADLRAGLAVALARDSHEAAARAYVNLGEMLHTFGDWAGFADNADTGLAFATEHGLWQYCFLSELQQHITRLHRGDWDAAEAGLRDLAQRGTDPSMFDAAMLAVHGRLLARRGRAEAEELLAQAWRRARAQRAPLGMNHAGRALVEWAWLTGRPERAREVAAALLPSMGSPGWTRLRGELLRYLARAGLPAEPFEGCPEEYAAGLRGDWRAAAAAWHERGDPYERALELAESGEVEPTLEALRVLDGLGAAAAAELVRSRLRQLGVTRPPRGPRSASRPNPAGLTQRQLDVLELLVAGATNAEIAERLLLSVRTVDHHVSAILTRLGARTRREAVARARALQAGEVASDMGSATGRAG